MTPFALQPLAETSGRHPVQDCQEIIERIKNCRTEEQHGAQYRVCMETYRKVLDCMGRWAAVIGCRRGRGSRRGRRGGRRCAERATAQCSTNTHARQPATRRRARAAAHRAPRASRRRQEELEYREKQVTEPCGPPAAAPG
jgi:hypothetical protein